MDPLARPLRQRLQGGNGGLEHPAAYLGIGLGFLIGIEVHRIIRQHVEEVYLLGDLRQPFAPGLEQGGNGCRIIGGIPDGLTDVRLRHLGKGGGLHTAQIHGIEVVQLGPVENSRRLGDTGDVEGAGQALQVKDLLLRQLPLGAPAQQGHIVEDGLRQIALGLQVLVGGVAVALGHLVLGVPHHRGAVHIGGHLPAEGVIQQVILRGGGQILAAPDHMGDAHQVVVDDVGEVIGRQTVPLHQHLVVQGAVFHGDVAENGIMEGGDALRRDALTDDIGLACGYTALRLLQGQVAAGVRRPVKLAGILLRLRLFTEAVIRAALFHQQPGILSVGIPPLGLDIRGHRAAHIGAFVVSQAALGHGAVDHVHRAVHIAALVRVLDAEDEIPAVGPGNEPGIQRRAQVAHMHIACGGRGEPGPDPSMGDLGLHLVKIGLIQRHAFFLPNLDN